MTMRPRTTRQTTLRIGVLGFDGVNALDLTGPLEAFANATQLAAAAGAQTASYELIVIGIGKAAFAAESGILFRPHCSLREAPELDTLIVPGGQGLRDAATNAKVAAWIAAHVGRFRRIASVCTGIYGLAPTGVLDGRNVATHWRWAAEVARRFPNLKVDGNALFIKDGRYYTSGGITAGIDLALALIEEDLGPQAALAVARELVVYLKRPGGQEQYSEPLRFQVRSTDGFADLIAWIEAHLDRDLSVDALAARACLSARHFSRRFAMTFGCTPAEHVGNVRMSEARRRLMHSAGTIDRIAASLGFSSADPFRRAFERRFGLPPSSYRQRFAVGTRDISFQTRE
jgi:transcriptional regulator GlxA family with amidase domain